MHNLLKIGPTFGGGFGEKTLSVESVVEGILAYMNIDNVSDGFLIGSRIFLSGKMRGPSFEYNIFSQ